MCPCCFFATLGGKKRNFWSRTSQKKEKHELERKSNLEEGRTWERVELEGSANLWEGWTWGEGKLEGRADLKRERTWKKGEPDRSANLEKEWTNEVGESGRTRTWKVDELGRARTWKTGELEGSADLWGRRMGGGVCLRRGNGISWGWVPGTVNKNIIEEFNHED